MGNNTVVYTALTGKDKGLRDGLIEPKIIFPNCDYVLFTDVPNISSRTYQIRRIDSVSLSIDSIKLARMIKVLPHVFLPDYTYSLWVDGRIEIKVKSLQDLIDRYLDEDNLAVFPHQHRRKLVEEVESCITRRKDNPYILHKQLESYLNEGYDPEQPLAETGVLLRRHMEEDVIRFSKAWWKEILNHSKRDQISFPYVAWEQNFSYTPLPGYIWRNEYFTVLERAATENDRGLLLELRYIYEYLKLSYLS